MEWRVLEYQSFSRAIITFGVIVLLWRRVGRVILLILLLLILLIVIFFAGTPFHVVWLWWLIQE